MQQTTLGLMFLAFVACNAPGSNSNDEEPPSQVAIRDSLRTKIVEYTSLATTDTASWLLLISDSVQIGRLGLYGEPEYFFGQTRGALRLPDGRIAVADNMAHSIRVFEPDGSSPTSVGRRGQGPGEFVQILGLFRLAGDSILVPDRGNRWTMLDRNGTLVGSGRFDMTDWIGDIYPMIEGAFADGTLLVRHGGYTAHSAFPGVDGIGMAESFARFYRADRFGARLAEFGAFPAGTSIYPTNNMRSGRGGAWQTWSTGLGPYHMARGTRFFSVPAGLREVHIFRIDGVLERILRVSGGALKVEHLEYKPSKFPTNVALEARASLAKGLEVLRERVGPSPFSDFTVDDEGYIWFREDVREDYDRTMPVRWYVFDPEGLFRTIVRLPYHWRAYGERNLRIGRDYILVLERSEFSEETFILVPLVRR